MQATATRWTARQARYDTWATVLGVSAGGGLPVHYVPTRHGLVARTWMGHDLVSVVLLRRGNAGATFQGTLQLVRGGWMVVDSRDNHIGTFGGDFLDAEAALLRLRTGVRSVCDYPWPRHLLAELRAERPKAKCDVCGNRLGKDGACTRPDTHW